jgi:hypothetical protein
MERERKNMENLRQDSNGLRSEIITRDHPKTKHDVRQDVITPVDPSGNYMYHQVHIIIIIIIIIIMSVVPLGA